MTVFGDAIRRTWGECVWTARDLLRMRVPWPTAAMGPVESVPTRFGDATAAEIGEQQLERP